MSSGVTERPGGAEVATDGAVMLAAAMVDLGALVDRDGRYRFVTPSLACLLGAPAAALIGRRALASVHRADRREAVRAFARGLHLGVVASCSVRAAVDERWLEVVMRLLPAGDGVAVVARDDRYRLAALASLREHERRHRDVIERADVGVYRHHARRGWLLTNPALRRLLGVERLHGPVVGGPGGQALVAAHAAALASGVATRRELAWRTDDGRLVAARLLAWPVDAEGAVVDALVEPQPAGGSTVELAAARRRAAAFATGVLDDLTRPLAALEREPVWPGPAAADPRVALRALAAALADLVVTLRGEPAAVQVDQVLAPLCLRLRDFVGVDVRVRYVGLAVAWVLLDPDVLARVVGGMCLAMARGPRRGPLAIITARVELRAGRGLDGAHGGVGPFVCIIVTDVEPAGGGVPPQAARRVERFELAELGLAVVGPVVALHGGWVEAEGGGDAGPPSWRLYLPAVDGDAGA